MGIGAWGMSRWAGVWDGLDFSVPSLARRHSSELLLEGDTIAQLWIEIVASQIELHTGERHKGGHKRVSGREDGNDGHRCMGHE